MSEFRFLADMHIPVAAIETLQEKGIDIVRSLEAGFEQTEKDLVLMEYAAQENRVIITCDQGFEKQAYQWKAEERPHPSILYLSMAKGDCKNVGLIIRWVDLICGASDPETEYVNQIWRAT